MTRLHFHTAVQSRRALGCVDLKMLWRAVLCSYVALLVGLVACRKSHVEMNGQCAAVARSNVWQHEDREIDPITGDEVGPVLSTQVSPSTPPKSTPTSSRSRPAGAVPATLPRPLLPWLQGDVASGVAGEQRPARVALARVFPTIHGIARTEHGVDNAAAVAAVALRVSNDRHRDLHRHVCKNGT